MTDDPPGPGRRIYTAWGTDGQANTFIGGVGPPGEAAGTWIPEIDGPAPELIWTIEADSYEDACIQYNELQGWGPFVPMDGVRPLEHVNNLTCKVCGCMPSIKAKVGRGVEVYCREHAREFCRRHGAIMPGEEPEPC